MSNLQMKTHGVREALDPSNKTLSPFEAAEKVTTKVEPRTHHSPQNAAMPIEVTDFERQIAILGIVRRLSFGDGHLGAMSQRDLDRWLGVNLNSNGERLLNELRRSNLHETMIQWFAYTEAYDPADPVVRSIVRPGAKLPSATAAVMSRIKVPSADTVVPKAAGEEPGDSK